MENNLGFGCSNLLGDKTRSQGLNLLYSAYEAGVRHFDVAPYYGFGDAEGLLGEFLGTVPRQSVTVATKFGLQPLRSALAMKGVVKTARRLMRTSGTLRRLISRNARHLVQKNQFDVSSVTTSLERSLRELRTDYIDIFMLHEATAADCTSELYELLERFKTRGLVKRFGTGTGFSKALEIYLTAPKFSAIAQFDSNILNRHLRSYEQIIAEAPTSTERVSIITFGCLGALKPLIAQMKGDQRLQTFSSDILQCDVAKSSNLAGILLACAVKENMDGVVLFRSTEPSHIEADVAAASGQFTSQQIDAFTALVHAHSS